jgi:MerR family transcriptional regulator, light-induced transcriptional regulator
LGIVRGVIQQTMRIGELASRVGVSTHLLRAWENRYGLLTPSRSASGYRLYGSDDERRVRQVVALREQGVGAVEACRRVLAAERQGTVAIDLDAADGRPGATAASGARPGLDPGADAANGTGLRTDPPILVAQLLDAMSTLDQDRAHSVLDTAFLERSVESAIVDVVVPFLAKVGEYWERGRFNVAQEHFATGVVRRRLGALTLDWGVGAGPVAVLACPPGEFHDIILLSFGVLLGRAGWDVRYLGADTPISSIDSSARVARADAVVVASRRPTTFRNQTGALRDLGQSVPLWLAGRGATPRVLEEIPARYLGADLVAAVAALTDHARSNRAAGAGGHPDHAGGRAGPTDSQSCPPRPNDTIGAHPRG